jgi:hypothetical protein
MRIPATLLLFVIALPLWPQTAPNVPIDYKVDKDHPRLFLPPARMRLLQREKDRETARWNQFSILVATRAEMLEPGFAFSLYYQVSKDQTIGRQAVDWALGATGTDLRQLSFVYDWCQPLLRGNEGMRLIAKMQALLTKTATATDPTSVRSRALAGIVLSGHVPGIEDTYVKPIVEKWWRESILAVIESSRAPFEIGDHFPMMELIHGLRDVYDIDLREDAPKYFADLPSYHILANYPAPFPAAENDFFIPLMPVHGEPDLREAVRSRAAALSMVALDVNSQQNQFLQGWLMQDRYMMRGSMGAPYEFLWANPYLPGLSFHYLPNIYHNPKTGRLIVRSAWEDGATWFYQAGGNLQMFKEGEIRNLKQDAMTEPLEMGNTTILPISQSSKFSVKAGDVAAHYYLIGLKPDAIYDIEVDDEALREGRTDRGGVLELTFPPDRVAGVLVRPFTE